MKPTAYDKALSLIQQMLESRNQDLNEKILYLGTNCYLVVNTERVTREDLSKGKYSYNYCAGEVTKLILSVQKRNCEELYKVELPFPKEQDILEELPRITHMFG